MNSPHFLARLLFGVSCVYASVSCYAVDAYVFGFSWIESCPGCTAQLQLSTDAGQRTLSLHKRGVVLSSGTSVGGAGQTDPYFAGFCTPPDCGQSTEYRNWFAFALHTGTYATIQSATLNVTVPNSLPGQPSISLPTNVGTYSLHGILPATEEQFLSGATLSNFNALGEGPIYSSIEMTPSDQGTVVSIPINAQGIAYLQSVLSGYDPITNPFSIAVLGGSLVIPFVTRPLPALSETTRIVLVGLVMSAGVWFLRRRRTPFM